MMKVYAALLVGWQLSQPSSVEAGHAELFLSNFSPSQGLDAPVRYLGGPMAGAGVEGPAVAQLFLVEGDSETPLLPVAHFRTGRGAGYFINTGVNVPNFEYSHDAVFRAKIIDTTDGCIMGISPDFVAYADVPPGAAVITKNFPTFGVYPCPEPVPSALAGIGAAFLLLCRKTYAANIAPPRSAKSMPDNIGA